MAESGGTVAMEAMPLWNYADGCTAAPVPARNFDSFNATFRSRNRNKQCSPHTPTHYVGQFT